MAAKLVVENQHFKLLIKVKKITWNMGRLGNGLVVGSDGEAFGLGLAVASIFEKTDHIQMGAIFISCVYYLQRRFRRGFKKLASSISGQTGFRGRTLA